MRTDKTVFDSGATVPEHGKDAPAPNASIHQGDTLLDTYLVASDAIEGGMGSVWRVRHTGWNTDLAMKRPQPKCFLTEASKARFSRECEEWIHLGLHPNIVSCYYVREIGGTPSIFSEWMDGGSLERAIQKGTLYEGSEAAQRERILDIAIQFARGLHYAHEAGLIHQDVKPDNLLLTKEGEAKVADFGLAKARAVLTVAETDPLLTKDADGGKTILSPSGGYTPAYCSMEQMDGKTLTRRTDIYSWAVSVMEMLVGSRPWANGVVAGIGCADYLDETRVPVSGELKSLLVSCMAQEPERRPHDFAEIEAVLQEIYRAEAGSDYPRPAPEAAADTADSLNNRALSFLDLGKPEEAEKFFTRTLALSRAHPEGLFNSSLYEWRTGVRTDVEAYRRVQFGSEYYAESAVGQAALSAFLREAEKRAADEPLFSDEPIHMAQAECRLSYDAGLNASVLWHGKLYCVVAVDDGQRSRKSALHIYDAETGACLARNRFEKEAAAYGAIKNLSISPDAQVAILSVPGQYLYYDLIKGRVDHAFPEGETNLYAVYGPFGFLGRQKRYARRMVSSGIGHGPPGSELWDLVEGKRIEMREPYALMDVDDCAEKTMMPPPADGQRRSILSLTDGLRLIPLDTGGDACYRCDQSGRPVMKANPRIAQTKKDGNTIVLRIHGASNLWMRGDGRVYEWDAASGKCCRSYRLDGDRATVLFDEDGLGCVEIQESEAAQWRYRKLAPLTLQDQAQWQLARIESMRELGEREVRLAALTGAFDAAVGERRPVEALDAYREAVGIPRFVGGTAQQRMAEALDAMEGVRQACSGVLETERFTVVRGKMPAGAPDLSALGFLPPPLPEALVQRIKGTSWIIRHQSQIHYNASMDGKLVLFCGQGEGPVASRAQRFGPLRAPLGTGVYAYCVPDNQLYFLAPLSAYRDDYRRAVFTRDGRYVVLNMQYYGSGSHTLTVYRLDTGAVVCTARPDKSRKSLLLADGTDGAAALLVWPDGFLRFETEAELEEFAAQPGSDFRILGVDERRGLIVFARHLEGDRYNEYVTAIWDIRAKKRIFETAPFGIDGYATARFNGDGTRLLFAPWGLCGNQCAMQLYQLSYRYTAGEKRKGMPLQEALPALQLKKCAWPVEQPNPPAPRPAPSAPTQPAQKPATPSVPPTPQQKPAEKPRGLFSRLFGGEKNPQKAFLFYCKLKPRASDDVSGAELVEMARIGATMRQLGCTASARNIVVFTPEWNSAIYSSTSVRGAEATDLIGKIKAAVAKKGHPYRGEPVKTVGFAEGTALGASGLFVAWYQTEE